MVNKNVIDSLYMPNDSLGIQMFGSDGWNVLRRSVVDVTDDALNGRVNADGCDGRYNAFFNALFRPNRACFSELLGASAPADYIPWASIRNILSKSGSAGANALKNIPFFSTWVSAGREANQAMADFLSLLGLKSYKDTDEDLSPTQKAGLSIGAVLLIGGVAFAIYHYSKKKKRRG